MEYVTKIMSDLTFEAFVGGVITDHSISTSIQEDY